MDEFLEVLAKALPAAKAYVAELMKETGEDNAALNPAY